MAQGNGYNGRYEARRSDRGWYFIQQDGTFLTPGVGQPMYFENPQDLLDAVRETSGAKITVLGISR